MSARNNLPSLNEAKEQMTALIASYKPSKTIVRFEIKIKPVDMLSWLSLQDEEVKIYGANQQDTMAIAGIGEAACVTSSKTGNYSKVFKQLRSYLSAKYPYLQWYGGFCFDERRLNSEWNEFGACRFVLPRFELATQEGRMIFCCNLIGQENIKKILKQLKQMVVSSAKSLNQNDWSIRRRVDMPDTQDWETAVNTILNDETVKKVVLARRTLLSFKQSLDPWLMLRHLKAVTPNSYHFAFQFKKKVFLGASPERLFRRYQRLIESEALAGTMPKSKGPRALQDSSKNLYEHAFVVEAIEGSFNKFCAGFKRDKTPGILTLANAHHLITKFQGQLKDGIHDEDILEFLHPTPALGGTPRKEALAAIRCLEGFSRGWYAGPIGYVGLDWAEFVVGIRSGLVRNKKLAVFAGAGIVQGSEAQAEWDEVENKISNFIKIIQ